MTHHPVESLLGVYALDAVDADERAAVDAHLSECPRCRAEVDSHREVAAQLALSGAPAPTGVWDRIAESLDGATPPPLRLAVDNGPTGRAGRTQRQRSLWLGGGIAAAAAAVIAIVSLSVTSIRQQDSIDDMAATQTLTAAANHAFGDPAARLAELATPEGQVLARAAVLPDGNGYVLAEALPDLADGTYQLWGASGDQIVSLGALGPAPTVRSFPAAATFDQLMVTAEAAPVAAPTSAPLIAGSFET